MILTKKTRKKRRSWPRKIEIKHDLDQEKKKVNEISTKKKSKFQDLPFFFYKFPSQILITEKARILRHPVRNDEEFDS